MQLFLVIILMGHLETTKCPSIPVSELAVVICGCALPMLALVKIVFANEPVVLSLKGIF